MKRVVVITVVVLSCFGGGVVLAAPSGVSRVVVAKGTAGDISIEAKGPVEVTHGIANVEPGGSTGWISWPGTVVATLKVGELAYRNASEENCIRRSFAARQAFVARAGTVFEIVNNGSDTAEVHFVAFLPPGQKLKSEEQPANC